MREKAPGLTGRTVRTSTLRALGKCRAYTDSLHNEQFYLPHFHILHSSPLRKSESEWDSLGVLMAVLPGSRLSSVAYVLREKAPGRWGRTIRISDLRALGECRAYTDSLHNEQFYLPHLHILQLATMTNIAFLVTERSWTGIICTEIFLEFLWHGANFLILNQQILESRKPHGR